MASASDTGAGVPRSTTLRTVRERIIEVILAVSSAFSVAITATIVLVLFRESYHFFGMEEVTLREFFFTTEWSPIISGRFGIWPLICGTFLVTIIAMVVAVPLGLTTAIYLSEYAHPRLRAFLKPTLEVLAGIPTVVYGFFAVMAVTPALQQIYSGFEPLNVTAAGLTVGILCLPTVCSLAEDALRSVPRSLREAGYGLGGTKFDVSVKVVVPAALSGIVSAVLLAVARAIGETMIVALAAGDLAQFTMNPTVKAQTMTGFMAATAGGDLSTFEVEYYSIFAVGATLFVMTFGLTVVGQIIRKRFREAYQ